MGARRIGQSARGEEKIGELKESTGAWRPSYLFNLLVSDARFLSALYLDIASIMSRRRVAFGTFGPPRHPSVEVISQGELVRKAGRGGVGRVITGNDWSVEKACCGCCRRAVSTHNGYGTKY